MSVPLGPTLKLQTPLLNASGALEVLWVDNEWRADPQTLAGLDAYVTKTLTRHPREGNPQPRFAWSPVPYGQGSAANCVGLTGPGIEAGLSQLTAAVAEGTICAQVIISLAGSEELDECIQIAEEMDADWIGGYEINLSCPNVGGVPVAYDTNAVQALVSRARERTARSLLIKLPAEEHVAVAAGLASQEAGADALVATNTLPVRLASGSPIQLSQASVGISGVAIHPVSLRVVDALAKRVDLPIVGVGGIDGIPAATRMLEAGAVVIAVGTAAIADPSIVSSIGQMLNARLRQ